jgi:hypothetical protein
MAQCLYQFDDGLATLYDVSIGAATPGHIQYNGIGRVGVRFDSGASGLNSSSKSVWVFFRKNGNPLGNITVGVRKAEDLVILAVVLAQHASNIISSGGSSDGGHHGTG